MLYTWPDKNPASKTAIYSYAYIYPHFHQSWNLFVPTPKQNFSIYVKYNAGQKTQDWTDIFYEINSKHQSNRFAGNESVLLAFSNALRYFSSSVPAVSEKMEGENTNINFIVLEKIIEKYLNNKEQVQVKDLKLIINIRSISEQKGHSHFWSKQKN